MGAGRSCKHRMAHGLHGEAPGRALPLGEESWRLASREGARRTSPKGFSALQSRLCAQHRSLHARQLLSSRCAAPRARSALTLLHGASELLTLPRKAVLCAALHAHQSVPQASGSRSLQTATGGLPLPPVLPAATFCVGTAHPIALPPEQKLPRNKTGLHLLSSQTCTSGVHNHREARLPFGHGTQPTACAAPDGLFASQRGRAVLLPPRQHKSLPVGGGGTPRNSQKYFPTGSCRPELMQHDTYLTMNNALTFKACLPCSKSCHCHWSVIRGSWIHFPSELISSAPLRCLCCGRPGIPSARELCKGSVVPMVMLAGSTRAGSEETPAKSLPINMHAHQLQHIPQRTGLPISAPLLERSCKTQEQELAACVNHPQPKDSPSTQ